jgi:uncharacterized protein YbaP (TraB family)
MVGGLAAALVLGLAAGARAEEAAGDWTGVLKTAPYGDLTLALHLKKDADGYSGAFDDVTLGYMNLAIGNITVSGDHIAMAIPAAQATYEATWDPAAHQWAGIWKSPGAEAGLPLRFSRSLPPPAPRAAGPALAHPALWVVKSKTATVYLFGTIHALDPSQVWRTPALEKAFRESSELWEEVLMPAPDEAQRMGQLTASLGMAADGPPLSARLSADETAKLAAYVPIPKERLDRLRPWLAAWLVQAGYLQRLGLTGLAGADVILARDAGALGKPVHGFETSEQQMHFVADTSPDVEMSYLRKMLADVGEGKAYFEPLERAWLAGDDAVVEKRVVARMREMAPQIYRVLLVERNQRWVPQIEAMLATPGVRFVAVGEGHLLGPDSVLALLKKDGWKIERVR